MSDNLIKASVENLSSFLELASKIIEPDFILENKRLQEENKILRAELDVLKGVKTDLYYLRCISSSSSIIEVEYSSKNNKTLRIKFRNGSIYDYKNVNIHLASKFRDVIEGVDNDFTSIGKFFVSLIKGMEYVRVA